jgi:hypothetical protein
MHFPKYIRHSLLYLQAYSFSTLPNFLQFSINSFFFNKPLSLGYQRLIPLYASLLFHHLPPFPSVFCKLTPLQQAASFQATTFLKLPDTHFSTIYHFLSAIPNLFLDSCCYFQAATDTLLIDSAFVKAATDTLLINSAFVQAVTDTLHRNLAFVQAAIDTLLINSTFVQASIGILRLSSTFVPAATYTLLVNSAFVQAATDTLLLNSAFVKLPQAHSS